jgi:hypothetical protein
LLRRRELLQLKIARNTRARIFRALAPKLCSAGIRRFARMPPEECRASLGALASMPGRDERFYWPEIAGAQGGAWTTPQERAALLQRALAACVRGETRLAFVFHPFESGLSIAAQDAARALDLVLPELHDALWIVSRRGAGWLIEVAPSDQEVFWIDHA